MLAVLPVLVEIVIVALLRETITNSIIGRSIPASIVARLTLCCDRVKGLPKVQGHDLIRLVTSASAAVIMIYDQKVGERAVNIYSGSLVVGGPA